MSNLKGPFSPCYKPSACSNHSATVRDCMWCVCRYLCTYVTKCACSYAWKWREHLHSTVKCHPKQGYIHTWIDVEQSLKINVVEEKTIRGLNSRPLHPDWACIQDLCAEADGALRRGFLGSGAHFVTGAATHSSARFDTEIVKAPRLEVVQVEDPLYGVVEDEETVVKEMVLNNHS